MYQNILFERKDGIALVTLNRPRVLNALSKALKVELAQAIRKIKADPSTRAMVLTGAGEKAFSAGQDLNEAKDLDGPGAEQWVREYARLYDEIRGLDIPIVAAVHGWAMGAGCQLALLADIRISTPQAKYGMPEIMDGIPCIFGTILLWPLVGQSRTIPIILAGEVLTGKQALEAGLTSKVVPRAKLMREAMAVAKKMAGYSPMAIKLNKEWFRRLTQEGLKAAEDYCVAAQHTAYGSGDPKKHMEDFLMKRVKR